MKGAFVELCASSGTDARAWRICAAWGQNPTSAAPGSTLGSAILVENGESARLEFTAAQGVSPSLEQLEEAITILAALAFDAVTVQRLVVFLNPAHAHLAWLFMRLGFEWLENRSSGDRGVVSVMLRRPIYQRLAPWWPTPGVRPC